MSNEIAGVKVGDVIVASSVLGEICGRLKEIKERSIIVESGRLFVPSGDGANGGFCPSVAMLSKPELDIVELQLAMVLSVTPVHPQIEKGWVEYTSGIIV